MDGEFHRRLMAVATFVVRVNAELTPPAAPVSAWVGVAVVSR